MPNSPHLMIHRGVWHYRLFQWSLGILDNWKGGNGNYEANFEYGTSLFHYLRVICLYMPLALLSNVLLVVWVFFSLFVIPIEVGGVFQYLAFWVLLMVLSLFLWVFKILLVDWAKSKESFWRFFLGILLPIRPKFDKAPRFAPSLRMVVKKYILSKHKQISPMITFVEKAE